MHADLVLVLYHAHDLVQDNDNFRFDLNENHLADGDIPLLHTEPHTDGITSHLRITNTAVHPVRTDDDLPDEHPNYALPPGYLTNLHHRTPSIYKVWQPNVLPGVPNRLSDSHPNKGPIFHPSTLQEEPQTPLPPTDHAHPNPSPTDTYIAAARLPDGESSNSDSDDNEPKPIPAYEKSNSWFEESKWVAQDPTRVLTASEPPSSFTWNTVDTLNKKEGQALKDFKDAMYKALDKVYKLQSGSRPRIKIPHDIVDNISYSFAHAQMLNPDLAARAESFYVDWPNQRLTVAVPTDFPLKKPWTSQGNCKYAFYHKNRLGNCRQNPI